MFRTRAMRCGLFVAATMALASGVAWAQLGYDRPGGDFASAPVPSGDPAICAARCDRDARCRSWSFTYPPAAGGPAMCFLKHVVRQPVKSDCCIAGVRGGRIDEPRRNGVEYAIDRAGGDYHSFDVAPDPHGKVCAEACKAEPQCRAWTYRRPGYGTAAARCSLMKVIKPPRRRPCCISGVVR
jgi:hypothetical protein